MASLDEIRDGRLEKLRKLERRGLSAYPVSVKRDCTNAEARERFAELEKDGPIRLAGRILAIRGQGKVAFFDLDDGTGRFQALLKRGDPTKEEDFDLFENVFDIGDFVEVSGTLFLTKQNEKTLLVESVRMLGKALRPLPEKWHGLQDVEERFRKRYLDLLSNEETKKRFLLRAKLVTEIRRLLDKAGYVEVETPALQPLYGGASAEPFITHHNALNVDLYLRISDELYLKRLLVGGFPKVYEIARDFRNEGLDSTHNPEFTMLEFYEAYSDARKMRSFVERMLRRLAKLADPLGKPNGIDFVSKFKVAKYADLIAEHTGLKTPLKRKREELLKEAERIGAHFAPDDSAVKLLDAIFKKAVREKLLDPTFVIDYPLDYLPLTKRKEGKKDIVDAFQLYAGGLELVKAFSELNDPLDQRERFMNQRQVFEKGEKDAQPLDEEFLEALEYGMPPAGGVGIGIDRLAMLFSGASNIKEVILFPTLKPKISY